ncbi:hypothetical protein A4R26_08715 [Niastella populi]|uniref:Uncharacterized protein n=1 Tax=Niastella populi TaxID=550983 RepID=A0A1V9EL36_9BACT|nr:hypothetical protein A4R26_08715 [Niastella populi]
MIRYDTIFDLFLNYVIFAFNFLILHKDYPHKTFGDKRISYILLMASLAERSQFFLHPFC